MQDLHSKDGTDGVPGGCQVVPEDQGLPLPGSERGKILHGFLGSPGHDLQGSGRWAPDIFFMVRYRWFDNFFPVIRL